MRKTTSRALRDFGALTFDCYGTLIDWETGIWDAFQPLIAASGRNDLERARETYQQSLDMFTEMGAPGYVKVLEERLGDL